MGLKHAGVHDRSLVAGDVGGIDKKDMVFLFAGMFTQLQWQISPSRLTATSVGE
jgi:hypothetical protein